MTAFWIKIIAIISMTFDHGAYHLLEPSFAYEVLRSFGRLAMPLFSFLIAEGYHYTRDVKKYFMRIFLFGMAIELFLVVIYFTTGDNYLIDTNIFLTLSLGLGSLILLKGEKKWLGIILICFSLFIPLDYGVYGVLLIVVFGLIREFDKRVLYGTVFLILLNLLFVEIVPYFDIPYLISFDQRQWFSVLAMIPIALYNGNEGKKMKYFLYIYYPLHLGIIILLSHIVSWG